jgi:putative peptidoglycan lipid II flippase
MNEIEQEPAVSELAEELAEPVDSKETVAAEAGSSQQSVARSAGIVSIAVMFSRLLGLVRENRFFAEYFFRRRNFLTMPFQFAFRIPNCCFVICPLKARFRRPFVQSITPIIKSQGSEQEAWRLASMVLNALASRSKRRSL